MIGTIGAAEHLIGRPRSLSCDWTAKAYVYMIGQHTVFRSSLVGALDMLQMRSGTERLLDACIGRFSEAGNLTIGRCIPSTRGGK